MDDQPKPKPRPEERLQNSTYNQAKRLKSAETRMKCVQLRKMALTYQEIGDQLGISRQDAHKHCTNALEAFNVQTEEEVHEWKTLTLARTETAMRALIPKVQQGHLGSIAAMTRVMERQAKLLGMDAPTKVAPTNPDGTTAWEGAGLACLLKPGE